VYSQWIGTTVGFIDAEIHSKVTGYLMAQDYQEGSLVKTGDLLFEVDPRPFQAVVDQAAAQLNVANAGLTQAKADVDAAKAEIDRAEAAQLKTQLDVKRYTPLVTDGTVSQQEFDDAVQSNLANLASVASAKGKYDHSKAAVTAAEAQIGVARSSLQAAQLNLDFTKVKSPMTGIAGIRAANIGDLVGTDQRTLLTTVSQIDPILVQFPISEQEYLKLRNFFLAKDSPLQSSLELILSDGSIYPIKGKIDILGREVEASTGTMRIRAIFSNPGNVLRPGYNAVEAVNGVRTMMAQLKEQFPDDVDYVVSLDTTLSVRAGIKEIVTTLWEALLLVIFVVFLFLQSFRATLIPALTVPVSLLGTFIFFPMLGFSINSLSLFGLVLAIGLVVDDAIVVVEAVELNMAAGLSPKDASLKAMEQVGGPVVAIALILAAVFVPTAFIPGITGRLYQQFAVTIAISVIISAFNALSLSPALCSLLLKPKQDSHGLLQRLFGGFNRLFEKATNGYVSTSGFLIRKMVVSFALLAGVAVGALLIGDRLPSGFLPTEDQGYFYLNIQLPDAASLQRTDAFTKEVESVLKRTNGVQYYSTIVGSSLLTQTNATYSAFVFVALKTWDQRKTKATSIQSIMESVNSQLDRMPAGHAFAFSPPAISGVGTSGGFSFMLEDRVGNDVPYLADNTQTPTRFEPLCRKRRPVACGNALCG